MPMANFFRRTERRSAAISLALIGGLAWGLSLLSAEAQTAHSSFDGVSPNSPCASEIKHAAMCRAANEEVVRLLLARRFVGEAIMQDVRTGAIVSFAGTAFVPGGKELHAAGILPGAGALPLSSVKLMLAAIWWEHEDSIDSQLHKTAPNLNEMLVAGHDEPARQLALLLRRSIGSQAVLDDLARFGFPLCAPGKAGRPFSPPACVALTPRTSDADWASSLSIGETNFTVSLEQLSRFLRAIGKTGAIFLSSLDKERRPGNMMSRETATQLQVAMLDAVDDGSAKGIRGRLGTEWRIGGKTGTGPADTHPHDGIFAGLVFGAESEARFTIICYVRNGGPGGGAAAEISADLARFVIGL